MTPRAKDDIASWIRSNKPLPRPLYPEKVAVHDYQRALESMVRFLSIYGWWPSTQELATHMRADHPALVFAMKAMAEIGLTVWHAKRTEDRSSSIGFFDLTPAGWQAVGFKPIEPWVRRPRTLLDRIAQRMSIDIEDAQTGT